MNKKQKVFFKTFGCRTNIYDTNVMMASLKEHIIVDTMEESDSIIVNSCSVTNGADVDVRQYINKINNNFPDKKILLTGCGASNKGASLLENNKINGVFGHSLKTKVDYFLNAKKTFVELGDLKNIDENIIYDFRGKTKAFIKVQEGCNFKCSYCIIPSLRGDSRSLSQEHILKQIKILVDNDFSEFVLTGTNVGSYGKNTDTNLAKLIKEIMKIKGVKRIRLGSMEPSQIDDEFKELITEDIMSRHYHIAIQHSDDDMLKIMRRRNVFKKDKILLDFFADKGCALGTDFIVAHPGETEDIWNNAIKRIQDLPLTHIHAFVYSKRDNTHSATFKEHINGKIAKSRLKELQANIASKNFMLRNEKKELKILVEKKINDVYYGLDQFFNKIKISSKENISNKWVYIKDYKVLEDINEGIL